MRFHGKNLNTLFFFNQQLISDDGTAQAQGGLQLGFVAGVILR